MFLCERFILYKYFIIIIIVCVCVCVGVYASSKTGASWLIVSHQLFLSITVVVQSEKPERWQHQQQRQEEVCKSMSESMCPCLLQKCLSLQQSVGIIGGKPNHAHWFIGFVGECLALC